MPAARSHGFSESIPDNPERVAAALAHVVKLDGNREIVLGQAWLAGADCLVTCGHVVEEFSAAPGSIVVKFPASGNRYAVRSIELHPSYVRQPDQLVKFDVALLRVVLSQPESLARPLPFSFEQPLKTNQPIATVRYPVHLGTLSAAPQPLAQAGHYLGHLRKHDSFHLLHDLALSPGDSGAPIFDETAVVAVHCGDTATLPGLNLPTTSIRLALWVDALRDLSVSETAGRAPALVKSWMAVVAVFLLGLALSLLAAVLLVVPSIQARWAVRQPAILPIDIAFNKPLKGYQLGEEVVISLMPRSDCWVYLFDVDAANRVLKLYPQHGLPAFVQAGHTRVVDRFGSRRLRVNRDKDTLHLVVLNSDFPLVRRSDWDASDPASQPLKIDGTELAERIHDFRKADPRNVLHLIMDAPAAK